MRALPRVLSVDAAAEEMALELLEQAMERSPSDALPVALAAWCHGLRGGHNFCPRPDKEKATARELAMRAAQLNAGDPLTETLLAGGYCLAHDLATAAYHAERALALDAGSAWAWGRTGWIKAYGGDAADAVECFQIARALAPTDPLNFLCSVGIAAGHFWAARYDEVGSLVRARTGREAGCGLDQPQLGASLRACRPQRARAAEFHRTSQRLSRLDDCTGQIWSAVSHRLSRPRSRGARNCGHAPVLKESNRYPASLVMAALGLGCVKTRWRRELIEWIFSRSRLRS